MLASQQGDERQREGGEGADVFEDGYCTFVTFFFSKLGALRLGSVLEVDSVFDSRVQVLPQLFAAGEGDCPEPKC